MKRYFRCGFVRKHEMVVAVETDEGGDVSGRVVIPEEVGDGYFGHEEFGSMSFDECDEITEEEALARSFCDRLEDITLVPLDDEEEATI